jgi:phosphoribosyl-ATP pyrophosphohydrolase
MADERFLATLWKTIEARRDDPAELESYTRTLLAAPAKARRKVVEEAYEVVEAQQGLLAGQDSAEHLAAEAADLVYHLFVVLASAGVTPAQVYGALEARHGAPRRPGSP